MLKLPRVTGSEVLAALRRAGWEVQTGGKGSHRQLKHPNRAGRLTVPVHAGEVLPQPTLKSILSQAGMTADELRNLL